MLAATLACSLWLVLALPNAALLPSVNTFGDRSVDISLQSALLGMDEGKGTDGSARAAAAALGPAGQRRARRQAPGRAAHLVERDIAERLGADLAHAQLTGTSLSLVVADIENFKQINDRFGHAVGDQLLTEVAQVFARSLRELDLAGRYGGEEFVAILRARGSRTPGARPGASGARSRRSRSRHRADRSDGCRRASASRSSRPYTTAPELFEAADNALYEAKDAGKNRVASATRAKRARAIGAAMTPTAGA